MRQRCQTMRACSRINVVAVVAALLLALPFFTLAIGQMSGDIVVKNARRGQVIDEKLILISEATDQRYAIFAEGDVAAWAKFYLPGDPQQSVTEVFVPASTPNTSAMVRITVPDDARNGTYKGAVVITRAMPDKKEIKEVGVTVGQQISRSVEITITDKEEYRAEVSIIPQTFDIKPDAPLSIRAVYRNIGNVRIAPKLQVKIRVADVGSKFITDTTLGYPESQEPIKPRETGEVTYTVPTNGLAEGKYFAAVTAREGEQVLSDQEFRFTIDKNARPAGALATATSTAGVLGGTNSWIAIVTVAIAIIAIAAFALKKKKA